jgi:formylglycine-generating enzyme required for sulfatase activity
MPARYRLLAVLALPAVLALLPALDGAPAPAGSSKKLTNSIGMKLVLIPRGAFTMGAPAGEGTPFRPEGPLHKVEITRSFYAGVYEVTQGEYQKVMGTNPSYTRAGGRSAARVRGVDTSRFPVENVDWHDAVKFSDKLSGLPAEKGARRFYRLPTEAEWEYACRAGARERTPFNLGKRLTSAQANCSPSTHNGPCKVGSYKPNAWGLYDMHGNVWEWTADWYGAYPAGKGVIRDPRGPATGSQKVFRGGSWANAANYLRSAVRYPAGPTAKNDLIGFRVVCTVGRR